MAESRDLAFVGWEPEVSWLIVGGALRVLVEALALFPALEDEAGDCVVDWLVAAANGDGVSWLGAGFFETAIGVDGAAAAAKTPWSMSSKSKGSSIGGAKGA